MIWNGNMPQPPSASTTLKAAIKDYQMTSVLWKVLFIQTPDHLYHRGGKFLYLQDFLVECLGCKISAIIVEKWISENVPCSSCTILDLITPLRRGSKSCAVWGKEKAGFCHLTRFLPCI